jgi:hypothetical protein
VTGQLSLPPLGSTVRVPFFELFVFYSNFFRFSANPNHLMSPLQPTSAGYNPMVGAQPGPYGHPYGSAHPPPPPPPMHLQSQQQNPHMMSVQNGPVILVSNLNEDVS